MNKPKLFRVTTIPLSLKILLKGQHRFMSNGGFEVVGVSSKGEELQGVKNEEGVRIVELEMTRTISVLKDLRALWGFYVLCKKERPKIVHSHTPKAGIVAMLGAKLAGVPIRLHTVAGMPLMEAVGFKRKILDFVEKLTYSCATKVYPNSTGLYDFIIQNRYTAKEKLKVIGNGSSNGIDTFFFSRERLVESEVKNLRSSLGIHNNDFVFIFVGRLVGDKGINELVSAFSRLSRGKKATGFSEEMVETDGVRIPKLLLVGPLEKELDPLSDETLQEMETNPNIISVGFQNDVRPYFAISDALVFPSYREGFPNVVMQAGAMGLPSIVSDINGCNEIIVEGENGTIIPVKNVEAIYKAMSRFINDPSFYQSLRAKAREMITSRYEQSVVWEALLNEYNTLLTGKGLQRQCIDIV